MFPLSGMPSLSSTGKVACVQAPHGPTEDYPEATADQRTGVEWHGPKIVQQGRSQHRA
jgi:hypothetical protein